MTPSQFREEGKKMVDWIADYYENIESHPVLSQVKPGEIYNNLPDAAPVKGESVDQMLGDVYKDIFPGLTHWQSPNFFAFFPANGSFPGILGDMLSSGLGVQGMIWATSPACTEVESKVMDWLVDMMQLPQVFKTTSEGGGVIQDSASSSVLTAVIAAREKATGYTSNEEGTHNKLVAYVSTQTHSSVEKAVKIAGIGLNNLRKIECDGNLGMNAKVLQQQIRDDKKKGYIPFFVCATMGSTSSNAMDPLRDIGEICHTENCWLHVDAAMAGTAMLCPEFRYLLDGVDLAHSYCFNPHKWMFTNLDCSCFYVSDKRHLINTFSILPEYLKNKATESGAVIDYRDWHIQLGRRFRALKLWFVIRHYGVEGLQHHIRGHVRLAQEFTQWVSQSDDFELVVQPPLNLVCFRHKAGDDFNMKLMEAANATGKAYFTHTKIKGQVALRVVIGQTNTEEKHVKAVWELIQDTAKALKGQHQ